MAPGAKEVPALALIDLRAGCGTVAGIRADGLVKIAERARKRGDQRLGAACFRERLDDHAGVEFFESDRTALGTQLLINIRPCTSGSGSNDFATHNGDLFFKATGPSGSELYFSDGTAAGTTLVCDIYPGEVSSSPTDMMLNAGDLFFKADGAYLGKELFHVAAAGAYVQDLGLSGDGSTLASSFPLMGSNASITVDNVPAGSIGLLLMSAPTNGPASFLTLPGNVSWIDPLTYSVLNVFTAPSFATTAAVPATPALVGGQVHLQSWAIPGSGLPASTSNGLQLVIGN